MNAPLTTTQPTLLQDPDALRRAWADLLTQHHHLHGPEAAALLGVPEAALLAARIGFGATALAPDLAPLLASAGQWGKVLLAARNQLGVALFIMDDPEVTVTPQEVALQTDLHQARVALEGVDRCYLFEERDGHGHTFSLNWFDAYGQVIGRLFLMSKSGRELALPGLQARALARQERVWAPGQQPLPDVKVWADSSAHAEHPLMADGPLVRAWAESAVLACAPTPRMTVALQGRGLAARYQGPLGKSLRTPGAVHASDAACKLHLRMAACSRLLRHDQADGGAALVLRDADGGSLSFRAGTTATESVAWLERWSTATPTQPVTEEA